ncbi:hypothetical protein [Azospirillum argentinense]
MGFRLSMGVFRWAASGRRGKEGFRPRPASTSIRIKFATQSLFCVVFISYQHHHREQECR